MNDPDRRDDNATRLPFARLLIDRRPFEVELAITEPSRRHEPPHFPILVDIDRETQKLHGHRVRYLTTADAGTRFRLDPGNRIQSYTVALADFGVPGGLTVREQEVLGELARGATNGEIARSLGISVGTVRMHVKSVLRKLALENRTQAAVWATAAATREEG